MAETEIDLDLKAALEWVLKDRAEERGGLFVNGRFVSLDNETENDRGREFFVTWKKVKNAVWGSGGDAQLVFIHSHPHGGLPSASDIKQMSQWEEWQWFANMLYGIVFDLGEVEYGLVTAHYYGKEGVIKSVGINLV